MTREASSMYRTDEDRAPWVWRKAWGGWPTRTDPLPERLFHAYDVNANAACEPQLGLGASCEEPNEGSHLCSECVAMVKAEPWGRDRRILA